MILRRMLPLCLLAVLAGFAILGDDIKGDDELPPDAKKMVEEYEKSADAILAKAEAQLKKAQEEHAKAQEEVRQRKAKLIAALEALADRLNKEGKTNQAKIIADQAEEIKTGRIAGAQPNPGTLTTFRGQNGKTFLFDVTGQAGAGTVWGTDTYTDDSALASVAVHAGVLKDGERGAVKVTILPGEASYTGSTRNGVTSNPYMQWGGSYKVEPYRKGKAPPSAARGAAAGRRWPTPARSKLPRPGRQGAAVRGDGGGQRRHLGHRRLHRRFEPGHGGRPRRRPEGRRKGSRQGDDSAGAAGVPGLDAERRDERQLARLGRQLQRREGGKEVAACGFAPEAKPQAAKRVTSAAPAPSSAGAP